MEIHLPITLRLNMHGNWIRGRCLQVCQDLLFTLPTHTKKKECGLLRGGRYDYDLSACLLWLKVEQQIERMEFEL